jgi:hypothetical protein
MHYLMPALIDPLDKLWEKKLMTHLDPSCLEHEVQDYDRACPCIGEKAREAVEKKADKKFGARMAMIAKARPKGPAPDPGSPEMPAYRRQWHMAFADAFPVRQAFIQKELAKHPQKDKPTADCEQCKGKGTFRNNHSPKGIFDFYTIGSESTHFTHIFSETPRGIFKQPKGFSKSWSIPTGALLEHYKKHPDFIPGFFVDRAGVFHEQGEVGPTYSFGLMDQFIPYATWRSNVEAMLKNAPNHLAIVVDFHL